MSVGAPELMVILVMLVFVVIPIWGIIDAATRPDDAWAAAGQSKVAWILMQVLLGIIGAVVYFAAIRPKLTRPGR